MVFKHTLSVANLKKTSSDDGQYYVEFDLMLKANMLGSFITDFYVAFTYRQEETNNSFNPYLVSKNEIWVTISDFFGNVELYEFFIYDASDGEDIRLGLFYKDVADSREIPTFDIKTVHIKMKLSGKIDMHSNLLFHTIGEFPCGAFDGINYFMHSF